MTTSHEPCGIEVPVNADVPRDFQPVAWRDFSVWLTPEARIAYCDRLTHEEKLDLVAECQAIRNGA